MNSFEVDAESFVWICHFNLFSTPMWNEKAKKYRRFLFLAHFLQTHYEISDIIQYLHSKHGLESLQPIIPNIVSSYHDRDDNDKERYFTYQHSFQAHP